MYINIIGTSKITEKHIEVLEKNFKILSISSTRKNSKNLKNLSKKFKIKNTFNDWKKAINFSKKYKNSAFFITSRIKENKEILRACCKTKKKLFIEKPVFLKSTDFNEFIKYKNQIFIGYNRIFYNNIFILKKKIYNKKNLNIVINCPESDRKSILTNSCHIISIIYFLFSKLSVKKVFKQKNYINCILEDKNKNFIFITFNLKASSNFSIDITKEKVRYLLSPIENLKIYNSVKTKIIKKNRIYIPKIFKTYNEFDNNKYKPGFLKQSLEFKEFLRKKKIFNDVIFGKKILALIEKILL